MKNIWGKYLREDFYSGYWSSKKHGNYVYGIRPCSGNIGADILDVGIKGMELLSGVREFNKV